MSDDDIWPLNVRFRRTFSGEGTTTSATVHCPRNDATRALGACVRCEHYDGVQAGREGVTLFCDPGSSGEAERGRLERGAMTRVQHVMTRDVVCVGQDFGLDSLVALLVARAIGGAPVVDAEGRPVGYVSKTDVLRSRYEENDAAAPGDLEPGFHVEPEDRRTVGDVMVPSCLTLFENATLKEAVALMANRHMKRAPVVDEAGRVVGMLSALDVVKWLASREIEYRSAPP